MKKYAFPPVTLRGPRQVDHAISQIRALQIEPGKEYRLTVIPFVKDRSLAQNALYYMWIGQIAKQRQDMTNEDVRAEFKVDFGIPILLASDEDFNQWWCINGFSRLNREETLKAVKYIPVTSIMSVNQFTDLLRDVEAAAACEGWRLSHPQDMYMEALGR